MYGMQGNIANANFIQSGILRSGTNFITREAPGVGLNVGGGIEVVVPLNAVELQAFSIIK